jgi:hypothetical protein
VQLIDRYAKITPRNELCSRRPSRPGTVHRMEPMAEIESGETYSGIKFKGLNSWVTEVLQSVLNSK